MAPDYAQRGSLIHEALGKFVADPGSRFDRSAEAKLIALRRETLAAIEDFPDVHAIWSIRFAGIAKWFIAFEARRSDIVERNAEIKGDLEIAAPAGPFHLRGRADRIDLRRDGTVAILDFKTGSPPSARQVLVGFAPQLALEAAMSRSGAWRFTIQDIQRITLDVLPLTDEAIVKFSTSGKSLRL
jgi:ATP-dependent helicase/nuclease subunit B